MYFSQFRASTKRFVATVSVAIAFSAFTAIAAPAQVLITDIPVGSKPTGGALNTSTNKVYVTNQCGGDPSCSSPAGTVSVIDGTTFAVQTVGLGTYLPPAGAASVAVNEVTNKIYTRTCAGDSTCFSSPGTLAVIDGTTLGVQSVNVGIGYGGVAVNSVTNKIYVANPCGADPSCAGLGTVTVVDGATLTTRIVDVGAFPIAVTLNLTTNKIYVVNRYGNDPMGNSHGTVTVIDGDTLATQSVDVGFSPGRAAANPITNKIYVTNTCGNGQCVANPGTVTVIDGGTLATQTVTVDLGPFSVAVNPATNKVYVGNICGTDPTCHSNPTVSVIDGVTLLTSDAAICIAPGAPVGDIGVDEVRNKIYLPCRAFPGTLTVLDGATNQTTTLYVDFHPTSAIVNPITNLVFVPNNSTQSGTVSVIAGGIVALRFGSMTPCRLVDTRDPDGPLGGPAMQGNTTRSFPLLESTTCYIPPAAAYSLNVTVVPHEPLGYLTIWPTGQSQPLVSTMNSYDGRVKANAAIVSAGDLGAVSVYVTDTSDVILDINGYFTAYPEYTYQFYPMVPCRVVDTRRTDFPQGLGAPSFGNRETRPLPVLANSPCLQGLPQQPQAYSFNVTVAPIHGQALNYLTIWPSDQQQPYVSTLNNPTATAVANGAIVPAAANGDISVFTSNSTDVIIDINGYFATPGQGGYSFYPVAPCRVLDTRNNNGQPFQHERTVNVVGSPCAPPSSATAYVFNATVVPQGFLNYLTLWPDGLMQPFASTLNANDGLVTSNMAIIPTTNGSIDAYASQLTHLILDISGYFAP